MCSSCSGRPFSRRLRATFHPSSLTEAAAQRIRLETHDVVGIDITLQRSRRFNLSGMVLDSRGVPAAFTTAALARTGYGVTNARQFQTDPLGRFEVLALDPGEYRLLVGSGMWSGLGAVNGRTEFAEVPFTVNTDLADFVVVTQPGIGLAGQVVFAEGAPATPPTVRITLRRPDRSAARAAEIVATMDDQHRFYASDVFGPRLVRVSGLPAGWSVKAVTLGGPDITDQPTIFTRDHDGQLQILLSSRSSTIEGQVRIDDAGPAGDATVYVFAEERGSWSLSSPRTHFSDVRERGAFSVGGLSAGRYYAIAIAREGFRIPPDAGEAFFELLTREATPFVVGDDERRTIELRLWRWPE